MPKAKTKAASANTYAVLGSDESEVKRVAAELASNLTPPDAGDFGLEVIDGAADNADQAEARVRSAIEAVQTLPFFGNAKVVWLKNVNFVGDDQKARSATVQSALEELSELVDSGFGPGITLLISAIDVDKRRSFYKTLLKRAEVQVFDRLDSGRSGWEEEALEMVQQRAKKRKLQFDEDALDLFVLLTGGDTRQIDNELEKIDTFLGKDRGVNAELVRELVPLSRAGVIFELGNALAGARSSIITEAGATFIGSRRKRDRNLAGGDRSYDPQFIAREGFDGTISPSTAAFPVPVHLRNQPPSIRGNGSFASQERWLGQRLWAWDRRTTGGPIRNDPIN